MTLVSGADGIDFLPGFRNQLQKPYSGFADPEQRYRQRYADLAVHPEVREMFRARARLTSAQLSTYFVGATAHLDLRAAASDTGALQQSRVITCVVVLWSASASKL